MEPNSLSFGRFECTLHDSGVLSSESWNFYKLKRRDLISWGNQFCRISELFGSHFCFSILKVLWTQIHSHFLDFNALLMILEYFSQSLDISSNMGDLISGGNQFCRMSELFGPPFFILFLKVLWSQILCH